MLTATRNWSLKLYRHKLHLLVFKYLGDGGVGQQRLDVLRAEISAAGH